MTPARRIPDRPMTVDSRARIIETLRERAIDPGMGWLNQAADLLSADAVEEDRPRHDDGRPRPLDPLLDKGCKCAECSDARSGGGVEGEDREAKCDVCGHEWRRHDPEDGQCDAHTAEPGEYGPCQCGRDLAWMQRRIAGLSRSALVSGGSVEGDRLDDECEHVYSYTSVDGRWFCADCTPGGGVEASREDRRTRLARHVERASAQVRSHPAYRPELDNPSLVPALEAEVDRLEARVVELEAALRAEMTHGGVRDELAQTAATLGGYASILRKDEWEYAEQVMEVGLRLDRMRDEFAARVDAALAAASEGGCRCSYCNGTGRKKVIGMVYSDREGVQAERDCDWCDGSGSRLPEPDDQT